MINSACCIQTQLIVFMPHPGRHMAHAHTGISDRSSTRGLCANNTCAVHTTPNILHSTSLSAGCASIYAHVRFARCICAARSSVRARNIIPCGALSWRRAAQTSMHSSCSAQQRARSQCNTLRRAAPSAGAARQACILWTRRRLLVEAAVLELVATAHLAKVRGMARLRVRATGRVRVRVRVGCGCLLGWDEL